jgi:hypothetical protein
VDVWYQIQVPNGDDDDDGGGGGGESMSPHHLASYDQSHGLLGAGFGCRYIVACVCTRA